MKCEPPCFNYGTEVSCEFCAPRDAQAEPSETVRVACVTLDGTTLTIPAKDLGDMFGSDDNDEQDTYTLTFKTITRAEFEALGEFNGF